MTPLFPIRIAQPINVTIDQILAYILQAPPADYPSLLDSCQYRDYGLFEGRYLIAATKPHCRVIFDGSFLWEYDARGQCQRRTPGLARLDEILATYAPIISNVDTDNYRKIDFERSSKEADSNHELKSRNEIKNSQHQASKNFVAAQNKKSSAPIIADGLRLPGVNGLAIGFCCYELGHQFEHWPHSVAINYTLPQLFLACYTTVLIYDYLEQRATVVSLAAEPTTARQQISELQMAITAAPLLTLAANTATIATTWPNLQDLPDNLLPPYQSNFTPESYLAAVAQIKSHIKAGDIYQANLTQQLRLDLTPDLAAAIFYQLRQHFPVPFAALLRAPDWAIVSGSPECFLAHQDRKIASYPIKGTRRRGTTPLSDQQQAAWLQHSEKDRAENVMIVDLLRNDLGRICEIGSIDASQILQVQTFPTLFHLVSQVTGQLRAGISWRQILAATFPCGSITGAPKLRAMQILESLEALPRQLSMGAVGWIGYDQTFCWNVAIRTLVIQQHTGYFSVGGGIVADSDPAAEYAESWLKAQALLRAIAVAKLSLS